jgi:hypothetical protein
MTKHFTTKHFTAKHFTTKQGDSYEHTEHDDHY